MRIRTFVAAPIALLALGPMVACSSAPKTGAEANVQPIAKPLSPTYRGRRPPNGGVSENVNRGAVAPVNPFATRARPTGQPRPQGLSLNGLRPLGLPRPGVDRVVNPELDMKVLVLSADGTEPSVSTVVSALAGIGVPYEVRVVTEAKSKLTDASFSSGSHGNYQGIVLATNALVHLVGDQWVSALAADEWEALARYEQAFGIREVSAYTYPDASFGMVPNPTPLSQRFEVTLTDEGRAAFPHLQPTARIPIAGAYCYLSKAAPGGATPLLVDGAGNALAVTLTRLDGREVMAFMFDNADFLLHAQLLGYGIASWVTRGVFLGEQHAFASAQIDDWFLPDQLYRADGEFVEYRNTAKDVDALVAWQKRLHASPLFQDFKLDLFFNGFGTTDEYSNPEGGPDDLPPASRAAASEVKWASHTWSHRNLNVPGAGAGADQDEAAHKYEPALGEITKNVAVARDLGFAPFAAASLVTPQVSGLRNPNALRAMFDGGVRFVVSDASREGEDNPTPNGGIFNYGAQWSAVPNARAKAGEIFMIPRRANNLFYNVSVPEEWTAEYNMIYRPYWGRDLTYPEVLQREADMLVSYLVRGDHAPWMFHASNLRPFVMLAERDGVPARSLVSELLDAAFAKYASYSTLPLRSPTMDELGARVRGRSLYNAASPTGVLRPAQKTITLRVVSDATVPVTGLVTDDAEVYGPHRIAHVAMRAGTDVTLPVR